MGNGPERGSFLGFEAFSRPENALQICADVTWLTSLHNLEETKNQSQKAQTSVALKHLQARRRSTR